MRFGICADLLKAPLAAEAGFDYIEGAMTAVALADDDAFEAMAAAVRQSGIRAEALNVMLPGSFRLSGPEADLEPVLEYLKKGFARAYQLGVRVQVFGSAGARNVPEGWPMAQALDELVDFVRMAGALAAEHGIALAVEPLNPGESNIINTVAEALALANRVSLPNVGALADWYHMALQDEGVEGVLAAGPRLLHCHIANPLGRRFPLPQDGADFSALFGALRRIGYAGRMSVEGSGSDDEFAAACRRLRECVNAQV